MNGPRQSAERWADTNGGLMMRQLLDDCPFYSNRLHVILKMCKMFGCSDKQPYLCNDFDKAGQLLGRNGGIGRHEGLKIP